MSPAKYGTPADIYAACKSGDAELVRRELPLVSDVVNECFEEEETTLLML